MHALVNVIIHVVLAVLINVVGVLHHVVESVHILAQQDAIHHVILNV